MRFDREPDLAAIRDSVALLGRLSDSIIKIGPFSLGLDGVLAWAPGFGEIYSAGAAIFLLGQGLRARVPISVLALCAAMMAFRTGVSAIPLAGSAAADLFTAHKWSARLIVKAIDKKLEARSGGGMFLEPDASSEPVAPVRTAWWRGRIPKRV